MIGLLMTLAAAFGIQDGAQAPSYLTGNDLYAICAAQASVDDTNSCIFYVDGVVDMQQAQQALKGSPQAVCMPSGVTPRQIIDMVNIYLRDNPAVRHEGAAGLIVVPLMRAFPCRH